MWKIRKTHEDRMRLINRLELKYAKKAQQYQDNSQEIKTVLQRISRRHVDTSDLNLDYIEEAFNRSAKTA
jgi:hypothetical protein